MTDDHGDPLLLVKGGASLELRRGIPTSRTSKDLDAVNRADMETVHDRLVEAGATRWEGFTAIFTQPVPFQVPGEIVNPYRFTAKLSYHGKPFASVPVEVSAVEAGNADRYDKITSEALTLIGIPASDAVPCMTLPWQVAQKIHACTELLELPRSNDRAHDLVDLQLLEALLMDESLAETRSASVDVFAARGKQAWPPRVVAQPHWGPIYARALEGLDQLELAPTVEEGVGRVQAFVNQIDASGI
ncbi:MAG: nucleotidyl transferase AbiEii/AbiGii toxin family protein [Candidatus Nanopelagicales bacterium]|nr:nucleotidyl transferase AbiEii/AbiGii toxin family protein [Candidatus Nanopelagicales bacterium]MDZ4249355.1 nucleotidyl transferase AbiEii/AbiGii toxin family protein [Candidatus Nanopelagicales bacterium]